MPIPWQIKAQLQAAQGHSMSKCCRTAKMKYALIEGSAEAAEERRQEHERLEEIEKKLAVTWLR